MPRRTIRVLAGVAALLLALPVFAGKVYQWKDANGVTHYTDTPPRGQKGVQDRELKDAPPAATPAPAATAAKAAPKPADDANCAIYRNNLAQLQSSQPVGEDADGDGRPDREMGAEERAQQVRQTEQMLQAHCTKAP